ncbi:SPOR domain-containing protein [Novosphingobium rosa]|uniref:SPOR domain-containing protein n=1 Tax=Novosphingobium rosa TaxID=76978 RepID=UPI00082C54F5|nr:SPOR domain-containing protein [Novosphingobium rosa]
MLSTPAHNRRFALLRGLPLGGALALALLGGAQTMAEGAAPAGASVQTIAAGESALRKAPRDAATRAALGRAYLRGGRFESAVTVLSDAVVLGDNSPRTTLSLALAQTALGHNREALALLQTVQGTLPAADYGLALALAGDSAGGVNVLANAAQAGDASEKLRQNLAYAYALDGRWAEARNVAAMDLSPDKLDERLTQWAATARPDATRQRVAALLGAPVVGDAGLPTALALRDEAPAAQLAAKAPAAAPVAQPVAEKELPAMATAAVSAPVVPVRAASAPTVVSTPVVEPVRDAAPEAAPAQPSGRAAMGGVMAWSEVPATPAAQPAARVVPTRVAYEAPAPKPRAVKAKVQPARLRVAKADAKADVVRSSTGSHLVQLGAFSNEANAEKARKMALARGDMRAHEVTITKATVNGREFWRVAALGFDSGSAQGACGRVKKSGGVCMAMSGKSVSANGPALALANAPAAPGHKR